MKPKFLMDVNVQKKAFKSLDEDGNLIETLMLVIDYTAVMPDGQRIGQSGYTVEADPFRSTWQEPSEDGTHEIDMFGETDKDMVEIHLLDRDL